MIHKIMYHLQIVLPLFCSSEAKYYWLKEDNWYQLVFISGQMIWESLNLKMRLQLSIVEGRGNSMLPLTREGFLLSFNSVCGIPLRISFCCSWCCSYFIWPVTDRCTFKFETIFYVSKMFHTTNVAMFGWHFYNIIRKKTY